MAGKKRVDARAGVAAAVALSAHWYAGLLGVQVGDAARLSEQVLKGFRYASVERLQEKLALTAEEVSQLVMIPQRTLARRKVEGKLAAEESDRVLRVARVFGRAVELFDGDEDAARKWLRTKNRALGEEEPLALARTDIGSREVEALIGRIAHGVVS